MALLLSEYREQMAFRVYLVICLVLLPFAAWNLVAGSLSAALSTSLAAMVTLVNTWSYHRSQRFWVRPDIISAIFILANSNAVFTLGAAASAWAFPTLLSFYWIHRQKKAALFAMLLSVLVSLICFLTLSLFEAMRIIASLFITGIFCHAAATFMEQQNRYLRRSAVRDHLTDTYNRRYMDKKIDETIERFRRNHVNASIIAIDIDHFKQVNDRFGHAAGDRALQKVAAILQSRMRSLDRVCRSGGEEFIIILPDTSEQQARIIADELRTTVAESAILDQQKITISCGVSTVHSGDNRDKWLRRCDQALYGAKGKGRDNVVTFSSTGE